MAEFKLCISDPKSGKTYQKELKDKDANVLLGKNIGESIKGEIAGLTGYELAITGGSDKEGFPMRHGIIQVRKRLSLLGGVGLRERLSKGIKARKNVCGHKINANISQINLKVTKEGSKPLTEIFPAPAAAEAKK